jgi:chromate transporter
MDVVLLSRLQFGLTIAFHFLFPPLTIGLGVVLVVLQFVGFVGGWQHPGAMTPLAAATVGALVTTWATFLPCFLFVFLGAPYVESLHAQPRLGAALTAITAAVVGVVLNLALIFAVHALWPEGASGVDWFIALLALAAFVALKRFGVGLIPVIAGCALAGLVWQTVLARQG